MAGWAVCLEAGDAAGTRDQMVKQPPLNSSRDPCYKEQLGTFIKLQWVMLRHLSDFGEHMTLLMAAQEQGQQQVQGQQRWRHGGRQGRRQGRGRRSRCRRCCRRRWPQT